MKEPIRSRSVEVFEVCPPRGHCKICVVNIKNIQQTNNGSRRSPPANAQNDSIHPRAPFHSCGAAELCVTFVHVQNERTGHSFVCILFGGTDKGSFTIFKQTNRTLGGEGVGWLCTLFEYVKCRKTARLVKSLQYIVQVFTLNLP